MTTYTGYVWTFVSRTNFAPTYTLSLQTYNTPPPPSSGSSSSVTMIATLTQVLGASPVQTLATFQVCPGTQTYSPSTVAQTFTIGWDGQLQPPSGSQPTVSASGVNTPYVFSALQSQSTVSPLPSSFTIATCSSGPSPPPPSQTIPVIVITYPSSTTTYTIYLYTSTDTSQPQGYFISTSSSAIPLYAGGYTSPSSSIYINWNGSVSTTNLPSLTTVTAGVCTALTPTATVSSLATSSLPNGGLATGAPIAVQSQPPNCAPSSVINGTLFTYTVVTANDLRIITYTSPTSGASGAFVASYPGAAVSAVPLCTGSISPYPSLFIKWDGSGLTSSSIIVTYNCTVITANSQSTIAITPPSGVGVCTTQTENCGGGGGGSGSKGDAWIWWVVGVIILLLIVGGIIALVIALHRKNGAIATSA